MARAPKQTQHVPKDWLPQLQRPARAGREFQNAVRELRAIHAQLAAPARRRRLPRP
jgi:hypothetical protein